MNYKLAAHKLEELKIEKLHEAKELHAEISRIGAAIREHQRLYKLQNKYADERREILGDFRRDDARDILIYTMSALATSAAYSMSYNGIDIDELMEDNGFVDFLIVQIGKNVMSKLTKRFSGTEVSEGEVMMVIQEKAMPMTENERLRLYQKITKKSVLKEARRVYAEQQETKATKAKESV
ncbi:MAG: hypothetical protein U9R12_04390 [Candidatus Caldatribacteriota bacterium]|nr:hypothetical protein [Candidatus Caldatribacteriota bacterium]